MTETTTTAVDLIRDGPLPEKQVSVLSSLHRLGQTVPPTGWCLIGGLMVEILLVSRGVTMLRPTDDGDIVGDVVADRSVLRVDSVSVTSASYGVLICFGGASLSRSPPTL
jgi:hypothetical protein